MKKAFNTIKKLNRFVLFLQVIAAIVLVVMIFKAMRLVFGILP